jgi:Tfp pilus assembly protein PilX
MNIKNENGIALIVALIIAFVILVLGSMALYISMQSTKISGAFRQYRSSIEAAAGAFEDMKRVVDKIKAGNDPTFPNSNGITVDCKKECLQYKLTHPTTEWSDDLPGNGCSANALQAQSTNADDVVNPNYYDLKYSLGNYNVYIKITNSLEGNTSASASQSLTAGGVTASKEGTNIIHPPKVPYLYRMEIISESKLNSNDKAHISLLYGY